MCLVGPTSKIVIGAGEECNGVYVLRGVVGGQVN